MPSKHKTPPVSLRLPAGDRAWVIAYAEAHGIAVNAVVVQAVAEKRHREEASPGARVVRQDGDPEGEK